MRKILIALLLIPSMVQAAQQLVENGETMGQARTKINANDLELYTQAFDALLVDWAGLTDPNDDRIGFWDDSAGGMAWLDIGTSLDLTGTTLSVTGLVIGTDVQAYDADLTSYATVSPSANMLTFLDAEDYATMRTTIGLEIGTDVQAFDLATAKTDEDETITGTWTFSENVTIPGWSVAGSADGPQLSTYLEDTDNGSNYVGIGSPASNDNDLVLMLPTSDPTAGQVMVWGVPSSVTFSDGTARDASQATWSDMSAATELDALTDVSGEGTAGYMLYDDGDGTYSFQAAPSGGVSALNDLTDVDTTGVTSGSVIKYNGSSWVIGTDNTAAGAGYQSTVWTYSDETCTAGQYAIDTGYLYLCVSDGDINRVALIDWSNPTPVPPSAPTMVISGSGPQIATFTYAENVTASTTADLCDDWSISMTTAGSLTMVYTSGDGTTEVVCSISEDVYDDDTVASASYTQGTIQASDDSTLMANIADFSGSITNSSSESGGGGATSISDDFSGDLTAWTQQSGTWYLDTASDNLDTPASAGLISHDTQLDSADHYVSVCFTDSEADSFAGVYFRFDGNTANHAYAVRYERVAMRFVWRYCTGASCTTIGSAWAHGITHGDCIGVEVNGTGASTEVSLWDFGATVPERASWGAADHTWTDDPANAADTGRYVGLYNGSSPVVTFDNFSAGSE